MNRDKRNIPGDSALGHRTRSQRLSLGLTQTQLARQAGINQGFLSEIERGSRRPGPATLRSLSNALGMPIAVLIGENAEHDAPQPLETSQLPLLGSIPAGPPSETQEPRELFPVLHHLCSPDRYCLRLSMDSMEPTLKPGDIVLVHYRPDVNPEHVQGRICACLVDGQPTLKRVSVESTGKNRRIILRGDNPTAPTMTIDDTHELTIQGVVLGLVSRNL